MGAPLIEPSLKGPGTSSTTKSEDCIEDLSIELDDTGPTQPEWQAPAAIESFLEEGDPTERLIVEKILYLRHQMCAHLDRTVRMKSTASAAARELDLAFGYLDECLLLAGSLVEWRERRLGKAVKINLRGPAVGLGAKIESILRPPEGPAQRLVAAILELAEDLGDVARRLAKEARDLRSYIGDVVYCARASSFGRSVPSLQECASWEGLGLKADSKSVAVMRFALKLQARAPKVTVDCKQTVARRRPARGAATSLAVKRHA